uniref:Uncharacterized protein n=1 Tax=Arundo donax TaxID=35708 RepID=A0A0A9AQS3_ARUDO
MPTACLTKKHVDSNEDPSQFFSRSKCCRMHCFPSVSLPTRSAYQHSYMYLPTAMINDYRSEEDIRKDRIRCRSSALTESGTDAVSHAREIENTVCGNRENERKSSPLTTVKLPNNEHLSVNLSLDMGGVCVVCELRCFDFVPFLFLLK